jgi:hypothetical protein
MRELEATVRDKKDRQWRISGQARKIYDDFDIYVELCECLIKGEWISVPRQKAEHYFHDAISQILITGEGQ